MQFDDIPKDPAQIDLLKSIEEIEKESSTHETP